MHKKIFVYLVILPIVFYVQSVIMVSSNKERGAPKRAQRYKGMNMIINEAVITKSYLTELRRMTEWLCDIDFPGVVQAIERQFGSGNCGMLKAVMYEGGVTLSDHIESYDLVKFVSKEAEASKEVAKMIKDIIKKYN